LWFAQRRRVTISHIAPVRGQFARRYVWAATARLGGIIQIDPRGIILGFVPVPNGDFATTNFAFGGPDNHLPGRSEHRPFWQFKAPSPGLIDQVACACRLSTSWIGHITRGHA
jgi:hypothetical protein